MVDGTALPGREWFRRSGRHGLVYGARDSHLVDLDDGVAEAPPTHLVLVQNFDEELKRLAPVKEVTRRA